jgi:hopanoid-associated phosphorylase
MANSPSYVLLAAGLVFEARIAGRVPAVRTCCGWGPGLISTLENGLAPGCRGIISFGIAGGLDPALTPGSLVVATAVNGPGERFATDEQWSQSLRRTLPNALAAPLLGLDDAAADPAKKVQFFHETGAVAVDMESHTAASVAVQHGLPFVALRAIADPASRHVPTSAIAGLRPDGRTDVTGVLKSLLHHPGDLAALIHVARDTAMAQSALTAAARRIGKGFGLPGLV